ncbi:hypothetical protein PACILC2_07050 [Paenibacillus cisolokensis]|uniref:Phage ABA sandwich domain-containing protein n=1 Tax=Paenibacillus cisolokensis TaxID=1658519 RepID=A0ABQ4N1X5_9BACL|nr:hypothetical protein [Paenibacillus cisolokensis]GIQ62137.1 hypothetical protein PACILC2_07050 [Paenibacillus cisolokensis]
MKPGPELDKRVAEALGWEVVTNKSMLPPSWKYGVVKSGQLGMQEPNFSTTWDGMRLVVEEMRRRELSVFMSNSEADFAWSCQIRDPKSRLLAWDFSESLPHAVCMAAIKALGGGRESEPD